MSLPKKKIGIFAFFLLTVFTITLKTYFSYYVDFSLGVKGLVQNLILLMNPYSLIALVLSVFLFLKVRRHFGSSLLEDFTYVSTIRKRCVLQIFSDFLTFSTLNQAGNVESMGGAVSASFKWYDFVYFIDTIIYLAILIFKRKWLDNRAFSKNSYPL